MKRNSFLLSIALFTGFGLYAQTPGYDLAGIPETVKKNATQVIRSEKIEFEVSAVDRARLTVDKVVTVLGEGGRSALFFMEETDKFISLEDVEIKVFDAAGKNIGKYKQKDLTTLAIADGLIDDSKMYLLEVPASSFPVTVEYKYELRYKGILSYPRYEIQRPGEGVQQSSYTARIRQELDLRYKTKNIALTPTIEEDGKYKTYSWSVKNLSPLEEEEGAVSYESRYPSVLLAPNRFKLDDYEGDMTSWKGFGRWYGDLKKGLDELPDERKIFYQELVKNAKSDREKIKIIYAYLQNNFRYVSIQLGIGGFRPFPADFTDKKKYGDCKALSNYMQAVLQAIGIKSYQALVNAGYNKEPVSSDFPCDQFNHVIVCVPQPKDSIWLECTSRTNDFATLGSFTENRNALLITEDGGMLVTTPGSRMTNNLFTAVTNVELNEDGSGKTTTHLGTTGEYKQDMMDCANEKSDAQKIYFINKMGFKDPERILFKKGDTLEDYEVTVDQDLNSIPELKTGSKMFLTPRIYQLWRLKLPKAEKRSQDFYFNCPFAKMDMTIIHLPAGYKPDALPESKALRCDYAVYTARYSYDEKEGRIYSTARIDLSTLKIPVKDYAKVKEFFDAILQDNLQRIVIKRQ